MRSVLPATGNSARHPDEIDGGGDRGSGEEDGQPVLGARAERGPEDEAGGGDDHEEDRDAVDDEAPGRAAVLAAVKVEEDAAQAAALVRDAGVAVAGADHRGAEVAGRLEDD